MLAERTMIMNFYTFGSESAPVMLLIHGVICPWQIWDDVAARYQNDYRVIVVELDGHTQDAPTEFVSVGQEAQRIEDWLLENGMGELDTVFGLSMGGGIAGLLWQNGRIAIKNLVLDGAPLVPAGRFVTGIITGFYTDIIRKSQQRDPKTLENCKKNFLPEKYLEKYLKVADNMSEPVMKNVTLSICANALSKGLSTDSMRILYLYGTGSSEMLSKKSVKFLKKYYPQVRLLCSKGTGHAELFCYHPQEWITAVDAFLAEK